MAERHVVPVLVGDRVGPQLGCAEIHQQVQPGILDERVGDQDVPVDRGIRLDRQLAPPDQLAVGEAKNRRVQLGEGQPPGLVVHHVDVGDLGEQPQDRSGLDRLGRIVVAGDDHDPRVRRLGREPDQLAERIGDRRVRRPDGVEDVTGDQEQLRLERRRALQRLAERPGDIPLSQVDSLRVRPMIGPIAEVQVRDVDDLHRFSSSFSVPVA